MIIKIIRFVFFAVLVRFIVLIIIGLNVRRKQLLPQSGPAIIVANHNSHLDTMVLMSLFPLRLISKLRPVAAADYFTKNKFLNFFSKRIIGIIPVSRSGEDRDPLVPIEDALADDSIIIFFPEGTRGEPGLLQKFKSGIARLAKRQPQVPVYPIFLHGLGRAMPKGTALLVPFFCDVWVDEKMHYAHEDYRAYLVELDGRFQALADNIQIPAWD